jgi:hypothetical protein
MSLYFGPGRNVLVTRPEDLKHCLPADKRHHYRNGYSMAEAAKSWVMAAGRLPPSLAAFVGGDALVSAHFEYPVKVWGGGTSMTDVMAFVPDGVIAVEAKARESFNEKVGIWIQEEEISDPASVERRRRVADCYARALSIGTDRILSLRYQLLHRALSAAKTARAAGVRRAWMIVQSFASQDCPEHARNRADFDRFEALVGQEPTFVGTKVRLGWVDEGPWRGGLPSGRETSRGDST